MEGQIGREGGAPGADTYMSDDTPFTYISNAGTETVVQSHGM